jgi:large subunit ribosomal protein L15
MSKQKTKKFRGSRTCGGGTHKNRRGAGNRGGRGDVGTCKHHFVRSLKRGFTYGKHGFKRPPEVVIQKKTVNVGELDETIEQLAREGFAEKQDNVYHIDLATMGIDKVLGGGKVTKPMIVKAVEFSGLAKAKIEESQGKAIIEV